MRNKVGVAQNIVMGMKTRGKGLGGAEGVIVREKVQKEKGKERVYMMKRG